MRRLVAAALLLVAFILAGCSSGQRRAPADAPSARRATPLAALLVVALCPELVGRTFSLASIEDGVLDTYVRASRCAARAEDDQIVLSADAPARIAVDRDFGPIALASFVHATVHLELRAHVSAHEAGGALAITLAPSSEASVSVEPVGALETSAQNWAALAAIELAPSLGVHPEVVAKRRLQAEIERALRAALARPVTVTYDAKTGAVATATAGTVPAASRVRVVPHGSAEVGKFPPTRAGTTARVRSPGPVAARGVCLSHLEHLLDADRRGDEVTVDGWTVVSGEARLDVPPMPCAWTLAVRATDARASVVEVEATLKVEGDERYAPRAPDRWVAFDALTLDPPLDDPSLVVTVSTDAWHHTIGAPTESLPALVILAPDESVVVRLARRQGEELVTEAESPIALDDASFAHTIALSTQDGRVRTTVRLRARVRVPDVPSEP